MKETPTRIDRCGKCVLYHNENHDRQNVFYITLIFLMLMLCVACVTAQPAPAGAKTTINRYGMFDTLGAQHNGNWPVNRDTTEFMQFMIIDSIPAPGSCPGNHQAWIFFDGRLKVRYHNCTTHDLDSTGAAGFIFSATGYSTLTDSARLIPGSFIASITQSGHAITINGSDSVRASHISDTSKAAFKADSLVGFPQLWVRPTASNTTTIAQRVPTDTVVLGRKTGRPSRVGDGRLIIRMANAGDNGISFAYDSSAAPDYVPYQWIMNGKSYGFFAHYGASNAMEFRTNAGVGGGDNIPLAFGNPTGSGQVGISGIPTTGFEVFCNSYFGTDPAIAQSGSNNVDITGRLLLGSRADANQTARLAVTEATQSKDLYEFASSQLDTIAGWRESLQWGMISTTDATPTTLWSLSLSTRKNITFTFESDVNVNHTTNNGAGAGYGIVESFKDSAGTVLRSGVVTRYSNVLNDAVMSSTSALYTISGETVILQVKGIAATLHWNGCVKIREMK